MRTLNKTKINSVLKPLGWAIPQGVFFRGLRRNHAVKCLKCGWIHEKRLDNLIYRKEQCPICSKGKLKVVPREELVDEPFTKVGSHNIKAIFRRYIAKVGQRKFCRKMMSDEWYTVSHQLAFDLMCEIAKSGEELHKWSLFYQDLQKQHPTKQGQDILPAVVPIQRHMELADCIAKRVVKLR